MTGNLHAARKNKNDEFYTQLPDIENELKHYKRHLKGKTIFLNCDDPTESNFWIHFILKFNDYGLKRVVATHYAKPDDNGGKSYKLEFAGAGVIKTALEGDGDFRSPECVSLLKEADLVITNPPFSLFREYVTQLVAHDKKFIIMGNNNAITYKETFKLIRGNQVWLGFGANKTMEFRLASSYERWDRIKDGNKYGKVPGITWFTNLPHKKRNEELILVHTYAGNESSYPKYDNYDAIEVSKVALIPKDYTGAMGVPITFLDKFNPEQFEVVSANDIRLSDKVPLKGHGLIKDKDGTISGKAVYVRIVIRRKPKATGSQ